MASVGKHSGNSQEDFWSSNEPLMGSEATEDGIQNVPQHRARHMWPYLLHVLIFTLYSIAFLTATSFWTYQETDRTVAYSPASGAVTYHKVSYDGELETVNPYRGEPRPELDKAWHDLLKNNNIRISKEELQKMNRTAIELYDGSGYFGQMSAYHHLHCLKFLRQVLHTDYYHVDAPDKDIHVDHCVDDIRQALMCHADTSIVTFDWRPQYRRPWPNFSIDHTCVNWEALDNWASERSFSAFDQKSLVHPKLGLAFPMIDGAIEEVSHGPNMHIVWPENAS